MTLEQPSAARPSQAWIWQLVMLVKLLQDIQTATRSSVEMAGSRGRKSTRTSIYWSSATLTVLVMMNDEEPTHFILFNTDEGLPGDSIISLMKGWGCPWTQVGGSFSWESTRRGADQWLCIFILLRWLRDNVSSRRGCFCWSGMTISFGLFRHD